MRKLLAFSIRLGRSEELSPLGRGIGVQKVQRPDANTWFKYIRTQVRGHTAFIA